MVMTPLEIVRAFRFVKRWSVLKCSWWRSSSSIFGGRFMGEPPGTIGLLSISGFSTFIES
jgi:hypothetical protein